MGENSVLEKERKSKEKKVQKFNLGNLNEFRLIFEKGQDCLDETRSVIQFEVK